MGSDTHFADTLRQLLKREPVLIQELEGVENGAQAVGKIALAAERAGVSLDEAQRALLSAELDRQMQFLKALRGLIERDEDLERVLRAADDAETAVKAIESAAGRHGVSIDAAAITPYLRLQSRLRASEELSDDELEAVAGGTEVTMVGTAGLGVTSLLGTCTVLKWSLQTTYVDSNMFTSPAGGGS